MNQASASHPSFITFKKDSSMSHLNPLLGLISPIEKLNWIIGLLCYRYGTQQDKNDFRVYQVLSTEELIVVA